MLIINLDKNLNLVIHLKMSGQLIFKTKTKINPAPNKSTRIIFLFNDLSQLWFSDYRTFGWIKLLSNNQVKAELANLGPEPLTKNFTSNYLKTIFLKTSRSIKLVLLDQQKIAGIGNIYANEALFKAKILPSKPANKLKDREIKALRSAIIKTLQKAIKYKGSSAADQGYIQPDGSLGQYQQHFLVYQQDGKKCQQCQTIIKRIKLGNRGTFYCPKCQQ